MKKVKFLFLTAFVAVFAGCQSEEMLEKSSENDKTTPPGDIRITIEGEGMTNPATRATDGRVEFEGGYATGAGLYNGTDRPVVEAHPDGGYEVSYFYGGPTNEPKKYDYSQTGTSLFNVDLGGQDHTFHCGFKEKKRNLTVNAGTGGSVSPSGTNSYRVKKPIDITATPDNGYEFTGWTITEGDVTIKDPGSLNTTATLHNTNSTITANFEPPISISNFIIVGNNGIILSKGQRYIVGSVDWKNVIYGNGKYVAVGGDGYISTSTDGINWTTPKNIGGNLTISWFCVCYGGGKFVTMGLNEYTATSTDGINWTISTMTPNNVVNWFDVIYANGRYVAVGNNTYTTSSVDGINWLTPEQVKNNSMSNFLGVTYGNGKFVAVGNDGNITTSTNGVNWTTPITVGSIFHDWTNICYGNGKFVVVGDRGYNDGYVTTSTDGENWTTPEQIKDESGKVVTATLNGVCAVIIGDL